ncbi:tetraspanin-10 [Phacochoerus africanus]|uniref:tetraspanin-10 n=1 Tax=Phacochoerus africanus TaxID=41426 RepID=UPI001FD9A13E|nr:tetraspanin-10 [Phacochoerus africanus]
MEVGERSPLLAQGAGRQEAPLASSSPLTARRAGPAPWEDQAWRAGLRGVLACPPPAGSSCLKCLVFLTNCLFSLLGLLALAAGLWGLAVKGSLGRSCGGPLPADPMLGLVLGGLAVSAVSLAGCLGALCENTFLLRCFSGGVLAFLVLEAVAGALVVALWGQLQDGLEHVLREAITRYQDDPDLCFLIDQVQLGLQCCGAASYQDWQQNPRPKSIHMACSHLVATCDVGLVAAPSGAVRAPGLLASEPLPWYFNCSSARVQACRLPASCCTDPWEDGASVNDQCGFGALGLDEHGAQRRVHLEGCSPQLRQWLHSNIGAIGSFFITVVTVQGAEVLLAIQLVRALAVCKGAAGRLGPSTRPPDPAPCPLPKRAAWQVGPKTRALGWGLGLQVSLSPPGKMSE